MINNKTILYLFTIYVWMIACHKDIEIQNEGIDSSKVKEIKIFQSDKKFNLSNFLRVKNAQLLPIEVHSQALLEAEDPKKIIYAKGHYFFLEDYNKPVVAFDSLGKFYSVIGKIGKSPVEVLSVSDFTIDETKKIIYLNDFMGGQIKAYDFDGNFLEGETVLIDRSVNLLSIAKVPHGFLCYSEKGKGVVNNALLFLSDSTETFEILPISYERIGNVFNDAINFGFSSKDCIITKNSSDSIYTWQNNQILLKYIIPYSQILNKVDNDTEDNNHFKDQIKFGTYLESEKFICNNIYFNSTKFLFVYDKDLEKGQLINFESGYLFRADIPNSDFFYISNSSIHGYLNYKGVVSKISSLEQIRFSLEEYDMDEEKKYELSQTVEKNIILLKNALEQGNGIIIKYTLKTL